MSVKLVPTDSSLPLQFVELTEAGKYVICEIGSDKHRTYSTGDYTINSDGEYVLGQDATLTFSQKGSPVDFTLKKKDGKVITGKADPVKSKYTSTNAVKLCRTWTITKTRISITDGATANADFTGCNLGEIEEFARKQGIGIKKDLTGISVSSITLTPSGTAIVLYSTGAFDIAYCDLTAIEKGQLKYSWPDASSMGYEFTSGTGTVDFQGENCILSVDSKFVKDSKKYAVAVKFVLAEKK